MKFANLWAKTTLPFALLGVVGCTVVTNPKPNQKTTPPPPPPTQPAPAATTPPQPEPTATAEPAPPPPGTSTGRTPFPTPGVDTGKKKPPPGLLGQLSFKKVDTETIFGGPDKTKGALEGSVYELPRTTKRLPEFRPLAPAGKLYTDSLDIASQTFRSGFPGITERTEYFAIRYQGTFEVANAGAYTFKLISDDGARVYIDNVAVVRNDGIHEAREQSGFINLAPGVHSIIVEYFQARGPVALQLYVTGPDGQQKLWSPKL